MRTISIKTDESLELLKIKTDVKTFKELKDLTPQIKWADSSVIIRSTKTSLQFDDALLPAENFMLFVFPIKTKSGSDKLFNEFINSLEQVIKKYKAGDEEEIITLDPTKKYTIKFEVDKNGKYIEKSLLVDATTIEELDEEYDELLDRFVNL